MGTKSSLLSHQQQQVPWVAGRHPVDMDRAAPVRVGSNGSDEVSLAVRVVVVQLLPDWTKTYAAPPRPLLASREADRLNDGRPAEAKQTLLGRHGVGSESVEREERAT